ncbi:hypothetical protein HI914_05238 [Erysiphe necator]|nr:hypothetical protein HI914_05238 [Erysiphe necator]
MPRLGQSLYLLDRWPGMFLSFCQIDGYGYGDHDCDTHAWRGDKNDEDYMGKEYESMAGVNSECGS